MSGEVGEAAGLCLEASSPGIPAERVPGRAARPGPCSPRVPKAGAGEGGERARLSKGCGDNHLHLAMGQRFAGTILTL